MSKGQFARNMFFWAFGVISCLFYAVATVVIAYVGSGYLAAVFAPLIVIPIANALVLVLGRRRKVADDSLAVIGTLSGMAVTVSIILVSVLSPLCLLACVGIVLLLGPFFSHPVQGIWPIGTCLYYLCVAIGPVITAIAMRRRLKRFQNGTRVPWLPMSTCTAIVLACVVVSLFPVSLTQTCEAAVQEGSMMPQGLLLLRAMGDPDTMMRACYSEEASLPWFFEMLPLFGMRSFDDWNADTDTPARETFYRVFGKPFNSVPRSARSTPSLFADYRYYMNNGDRDFATDTVGGVVAELSMSDSRMSGWIDPDEAVAHVDWQMHFHSDRSCKRELRAQILLPPHAVVSGCSLWIKGIRHDAVLVTRESSKTAYKTAAHKGETPLQVSTAGAGRVLLQSSTGSWGTDADLSVQITSPLVIQQADKAALPLPLITERNFSVSGSHKIALNSTCLPISTGAIMSATPSSSPARLLQKNAGPAEVVGTISNADLTNGLGVLQFARDPAAVVLTASADDEEHAVWQRIQSTRSAVKPTVIVLDGSATMAERMGTVCDALADIHVNDASIVWASDRPVTLVSHVSTDSAQWRAAIARIHDASCLGGQNNADALCSAIEESKSGDVNIVWLHGPQPVKFNSGILLPRLRSARHQINIYEYQLVHGPNQVIRSLDQTSSLFQVSCLEGAGKDILALFARLSGNADSWSIERQWSESGMAPVATPAVVRKAKHQKELCQLCVADLVLAHLIDKQERLKYGVLAEEQNLVTPLTSALVLERLADYQLYGAKRHSQISHSAQAHKDSFTANPNLLQSVIPVKPEPPMALTVACAMLILGTFLCMMRRRQKQLY